MVKTPPAGAVGGHVVVEAVPLRTGGAVATGALGGRSIPGEAVQAARQVEARAGRVEQAAHAVATGSAVLLTAG